MTALVPFPSGWFHVGYSDELGVGDVVAVQYFGDDLVLWRDANGAAHLSQEHCPHLGASFAHGAQVEGDCLTCPFHGWSFGGDGVCREIPYSRSRIPRAATLRSYPVDEQSDIIMAWHHPLGAPPTWTVPVLSEQFDGGFTRPVRARWTIATTWHEIAENSVDVAHFEFVHGTPEVPTCTYEDRGSEFVVRTEQKFTTGFGVVDGAIASSSYGPGIGVVRFSGPVDLLMVPAITPIDERHVDVRFSFMVRDLGDAALTDQVQAAFVEEIHRQMAQDIAIWEHKRFLPRPLLVAGDGPIAAFRRWATTFTVA